MLDRTAQSTDKWGHIERKLRTVWDENIWVTTSGFFSLDPFACLLRSVKKDRILYSVDYPFSRNEQGKQFIENIISSGMVTEDELAAITYRNAEKALKIKL